MIWVMGFAALIGSFLNTYTGEKYDSIYKIDDGTRRIKFRVGRDVRLFIIVVGALTNQVIILLSIVAIVANFEAIRRLILFRSKLDNNVKNVHKEFAN